MADRGNVPVTGKVHSRSNNEATADAVDTTDYPFSAYQPLRFNTGPPGNEVDNYSYHRNSGLNSKEQPCWVLKCNVTDKDDDNEMYIENSLESSKSGNEDAGSSDFIQHLGLSADGGSDENGKNKEDNTTFEDVGTGEDYDEEDETAGPKNPFKRFLECSQLFIRKIIRRVCDFPPTPRE